jgi:hypothetical protein
MGICRLLGSDYDSYPVYFSLGTILFLLISEMVLLITDSGDHNNSYPGCFPLSAILFPSTTEILLPCVSQTER